LTEIFPSKLQKLIFLRANCRNHIRKDTKITVERKHMDKRGTHGNGEIGHKMTHLAGNING
jgi:hypothetical protein